MRLFLYGTLLDPTTLATRGGDPTLPRRCAPATLQSWRRVALRGSGWPTLRRNRTDSVHGMVVDAPSAAFASLAVYEGDAYRLVRVVVTTASGKTAARTWIAPGGTRRPWKG
jgi:gamma-glutamylcyclotransferase (GGCT)/AIG2-like uncharacterized protein YtfP